MVKSRILILLIAALALVVVAAGCGSGGGNNSGKKQQGSGQQSKKGKAPGGAATQAKKASGGQTSGRTVKGNVPGVKVLKGTVISANPSASAFIAKPTGGPPLPFEYTPKLNVKLNGKKVGPQEIKQGQHVTVRFLTRKSKKGKEFNLARAMRLTSGGAVPGGATGGTTG